MANLGSEQSETFIEFHFVYISLRADSKLALRRSKVNEVAIDGMLSQTKRTENELKTQ